MLYNAALSQRPSQQGRNSPQSSVTITPSAKLLKPFYWTAAILVGFIFFYSNNRGADLYWLLIVPAVIVAWTIVRQILLHSTKLIIEGGKLRYETGLFSRSVRTLDLGKVQNVHVTQTFMDRMLNLGTISIQTAGEIAPLNMAGVEEPQHVADYILETARR
jgi:uncharacterized membrane protein YdbT with pleckstrin-like domain